MYFLRVLRVQWFVFRLACSYQIHSKLRKDERMKAWHIRWGQLTYDQMLSLGGIYIKLGQILSITGGFLPKDFVECLQGLQDQVNPHPYSHVERTFHSSFGQAIERVFKEFERTPIAAASLGQVHRATLQTGERVAVKILYPNIRKIVEADLWSMKLLMRFYRSVFPVREIERVHASLARLLDDETHYTREAKAMRRMAENFRDQSSFAFPHPVERWLSDDVLVMSYMEGFKITDLDRYAEYGIEPSTIARTLVESYFTQVLKHGFFHADPHPGNFLLQPDAELSTRARIVFLDFGACAEVAPEMVDGLLNMIESVVTSNRAKMLDAARQMGFLNPRVSTDNIESLMFNYWEKLVQLPSIAPSLFTEGAGGQELFKPRLGFAELRKALGELEYPEGWFYIERALVILFWLVGRIDPHVDIVKSGLPMVLSLLARPRPPPSAAKMNPSEQTQPC